MLIPRSRSTIFELKPREMTSGGKYPSWECWEEEFVNLWAVRSRWFSLLPVGFGFVFLHRNQGKDTGQEAGRKGKGISTEGEPGRFMGRWGKWFQNKDVGGPTRQALAWLRVYVCEVYRSHFVSVWTLPICCSCLIDCVEKDLGRESRAEVAWIFWLLDFVPIPEAIDIVYIGKR